MVTLQRLQEWKQTTQIESPKLVAILNLDCGQIHTFNLSDVEKIQNGDAMLKPTGDMFIDYLVLGLEKPICIDCLKTRNKPYNPYN